MNRRFCLLFSLALLVFVPAASRAAKPAAASTQPGNYTDWNDVDEVTIVQPFQLAAFKSVTVQPLDTSSATLPPPKDNSYADVKAALANSTQPFIEGMQKKLGTLPVQAGKGSGLIVRARITKSDPGSRAARYFLSFGAGAAKVGVSGEIIDGRTNKVLVRFTQERRSGFGGFGGAYRELLDRTLRQIGGDVGGLLRAF